jgi:hypothetical protein
MDSGIRDHLIAGFDGFHEFGMCLRFFLLRTDKEKVKDDKNKNQGRHRDKWVRLLCGCCLGKE